MSLIRKAGLVCCSNGLDPSRQPDTQRLIDSLSECGIEAVPGSFLYAQDRLFSGSAKQRTEQLLCFLQDHTIDAVFDLSGGDLANEVLCCLDPAQLANTNTELWGYSDLTCLLNAIFSASGQTGVLYTVQNLIRSAGAVQQQRLCAYNLDRNPTLFQFPYHFLRGDGMEGTLVGGNARCLLKLAGTRYFPETHGRILLLESLGGGPAQITAYLSQLEQMGVFSGISGLVLGSFTQMERENLSPTVEELVLRHTPPGLAIAKSSHIGHGDDSYAVRIGAHYCL